MLKSCQVMKTEIEMRDMEDEDEMQPSRLIKP